MAPARAEAPRPWADAGGLFRSFLRLSIVSLFLTGMFVLLVVVGRTPLVVLVAGQGYLHTALVAHVTFALNVWLLSFIAALWVAEIIQLGRPLQRRTLRVGAALSWIGVALMAAVPLAGAGQPVLIDYVPYLDHPVFYLGMIAFAGGIAIAAASYLISLSQPFRDLRPRTLALAISAAGYLLGLAIFGLVAARGGADPGTLAWGTGHVFQVVNTTALMAGALLLAPPISRHLWPLIRYSLLGYVLSLSVITAGYVHGVPWGTYATAFWAGIGVPSAIIGSLILAAIVREVWRPTGARQLSFLYLAAVLFAAGGIIALLGGLGSDTRVTAHYHGVVGAVTLVFMGLTYRVLEAWHVHLTWRTAARFQALLYGGGLLMVVAGLFMAGEAGTARKVFESIATSSGWPLAAVVFILGALVTIAGGIVFVVSTGVPLLGAGAPAAAEAEPREAAEMPRKRLVEVQR